MSDTPLVSIVTSCYNHEQFLDDYMAGLLSQTYSRLELILVDDGSSDESWEKIKSYEGRLRNKFERVIFERHENRGLIRELAFALKRATGEFFCITSSDDVYLPHMIEECVSYLLAHPDRGAVHGDTDYVYEDRVEESHWKSAGRRIPEGLIYEALLEDNFIMITAACFRTEWVRRHVDFNAYASRDYLLEDYAMCLDLAKLVPFGYIDKSLARYRVLAQSMSHTNDPGKGFRHWKSCFQIKLDSMAQGGATETLRTRIEGHFYKGLYRYGYDLCLKEDCWRGYRWLVETSPEEYKTHWHLLRALSTRHRFLWRFIKKIQETRVVYRIREWLLDPVRN